MSLVKQLKTLFPSESFGYRSLVKPGHFTFAPKGATYLQWNITDDRAQHRIEASLGCTFEGNQSELQFSCLLDDAEYTRVVLRVDIRYHLVCVWLVKR